MTPQLQQAIRLLALSNLEIESFIAEELNSNPLLEASHNDDNGTENHPDSTNDLKVMITIQQSITIRPTALMPIMHRKFFITIVRPITQAAFQKADWTAA